MINTDITESVSLATLGGGAAVERFDHELQRVLDNIADINTPANTVREVTLKVKLKPNEDRSFVVSEIIASSKIAPIKPETTSLHLSTRSGQNVATEYNPKQPGLGFERS